MQARDWYNATKAIRALIIDQMRAAGYSEETLARAAFDMRNAARTKARDLMADRERAEGLERKSPNMTWDEVMKRYKGDYEIITQKSLESDEDTDREVEEMRMKERDHEDDK